METISHNGTVFTKATVLAKKYRYTTDYIGQLCRAGKVESKLIGRAWFVSEDSLLSHKSGRYSVIRSPEIMIHTSLVSEKNNSTHLPRSIRPMLSKTTHRSLSQEQHLVIHHKANAPVRIATYHEDLGDLEPISVAKKSVTEVPKIMQIAAEPSKNIPIILSEKAKHTLTFEPLPEVALQGNLAITSLDDPDLYTETQPVSVAEINFTPQTITQNTVIPAKQPITPSKPVSVRILHKPQHFVSSLKPATRTDAQPNIIKVKNLHQEVLAPYVSFVAVPGFVLGAIVLCVGLLSLSSFVESDGFEFRESFKFNLASVAEVIEKLPSSY